MQNNRTRNVGETNDNDNNNIGENNDDDADAAPLRSLFGYDQYAGEPDYDFGLATTILQSNYTDQDEHRSLKNDLIQHQWDLYRGGEM